MFRDTTAISRACEVLGGQARMARLLGVSAPTVNQWVKGQRPVPIHYCPAIETATQGAVKRWHLREKDWHRIWPDLQRAIELADAGTACPHVPIQPDCIARAEAV